MTDKTGKGYLLLLILVTVAFPLGALRFALYWGPEPEIVYRLVQFTSVTVGYLLYVVIAALWGTLVWKGIKRIGRMRG